MPKRGRMLEYDRQDVLEKIRAFWKEYGYAPTIRQLCALTGISSTSQMSAMLNEMERDRLIERSPRLPRTLKVVDYGI